MKVNVVLDSLPSLSYSVQSVIACNGSDHIIYSFQQHIDLIM